ncbi:hypothetical protein GF617_05825 [Lelliottia sp. RWM.1]|nr:hypothetical protein [Lelliottia sp. RWM.1]
MSAFSHDAKTGLARGKIVKRKLEQLTLHDENLPPEDASVYLPHPATPHQN